MARPSVAILGASSNREKYGNKSVRAHKSQGYDVYPVNPKGGEIEGLPVFTSLKDVPVESLDRVSVYLPPAVAVSAMDEVAEKGCRELFLNPGADSPEVVTRAKQLGLEPIVACSILDVGSRPSEFPAD